MAAAGVLLDRVPLKPASSATTLRIRDGQTLLLQVARADLLHRLGRDNEAVAAYRLALALEPRGAERSFSQARIRQLDRA